MPVKIVFQRYITSMLKVVITETESNACGQKLYKKNSYYTSIHTVNLIENK